MNNPNFALIRKTIKAMEVHRDRWNQDSYVDVPPGATEDNLCGTTLCFAGFALRLHLGREKFREVALVRNDNGTLEINEDYDFEGEARKILGLDPGTAYDIFCFFTNDLEDFKQMLIDETGVALD